MPSLPWKSIDRSASGEPTLVLASRLQLKRRRDVPGFFLDALRVHRQVVRADGALGVALIAHLGRGEFFTLSQWRSDAAMGAMVETQPHAGIMARYREKVADSRFVTWNADSAPTWDEAHRRLTA